VAVVASFAIAALGWRWATTSPGGILIHRSPVTGERSFAAVKDRCFVRTCTALPGYPEPPQPPPATSKQVGALLQGLFEFLDYFNFPRPGRGVTKIKLENTGNPGAKASFFVKQGQARRPKVVGM
jgi:hypothetical protein